MSPSNGTKHRGESLHIELPPDEHANPLPWIIAAGSGLLLLVTFVQTANRIPAQLESQASSILNSSAVSDIYPDVQIEADGRDLHLVGSIRIDQSTEPLHAQLAEVDGLLQVREDTLLRIDPDIQKRAQAEDFQRRLASIDVASVGFQPGSVRFTQESETALTQLNGLLIQHPEARIRIEGHTDNTGADTVNLRVSRDRASAVADYFVSRGVASSRLIVTGYGATQPIADNSTEAGRARNRRIEVNAIN